MSAPTLIHLYGDGVGIDGNAPRFHWDATRAGFRSYAVPTWSLRVEQSWIRFCAGYEAVPGGKRWIRGWERVRPDVVLHRRTVSPRLANTIEAISRTHPASLLSYHPLYPVIDSKWRSEVCFRQAALRGIDVPRPATFLVENRAIAGELRDIGHDLPLILKPAGESEGRGIWLSSPATFDAIAHELASSRYRWWVAQEIVQRPLLYDGRRCDFRVYAVVTSWEPLRWRTYREAVVRVASQPFAPQPTPFNVVTSWSFNHRHRIPTVNLSASVLLEHLRARGYDVGDFWERMDALLGKVFLALRDHGWVDRSVPFDRRFYLTGIDVVAATRDRSLELLFLEHNYVPALIHPNSLVMQFLPDVHRQWLDDLRHEVESAPGPVAIQKRRIVIADLDPNRATAKERLDPSLMRLARELSRSPGTEVLVAAWQHVHFDGSEAVLRGPVLRATSGALVTLPPAERRADVLLMQPYSGAGTIGARADERAALERLSAPRAADRNQAVAELFREATRRGIVSNAPCSFGAWGRKDALEYLLREYSRASGVRVPRPETYPVDAGQALLVIEALHRRGLDAIVKPANGARGNGTTVIPVGAPGDGLPFGDVVVQELLRNPLLVGGAKADVRAYLLVDIVDPERSRQLSPVLVRLATHAYRRGERESEITNTSYRVRRGFTPAIFPIEALAVADRLRGAMREAVAQTMSELLGAIRWWSTRRPATTARRVLLWGIDLGITTADDGGIAAHLLEVNPHPQLFRGSRICDARVGEMLRREFLPALLA